MADEERTELATPKKRLDAIKKGDVAKSPDVVAVCGLLGGVFIVAATARARSAFAFDYFRAAFSGGFALRTDAEALGASISNAIFLTLGQFALVGAVVALCSVAANFLQSGFLFLPEKLAPDFKRLDPKRGFARIFSTDAAIQTLFGLVKIAAGVAIVALAFYRDRDMFARLSSASVAELAALFFRFSTRLALQLCGTLAALAAADYFWRRWKWERGLRMTPREIRDEMKEEIGDPQIKGKRRDFHRALGSKNFAPSDSKK